MIRFKKMTKLTIGAMVIISIFAFSGCGKTSQTSGSESSTKDKNQVLNLIFTEPQTLDVNACWDVDTTTVLSAAQEGLVRLKNTGNEDKIVAAGAKSWETSKDALTWTFHLRNFNWSDGKKVTAQHFVDSIIRLLDKKNAFPYSFIAYDIKNAEAFNNGTAKKEDVGVKALDDNTLQITLERPTPYFLDKLTNTVFKPVRLDVIAKGGEKYDTDVKKQVYCGPYEIKDWVRNNSMTFVKNSSYWDAKNVNITQVNMKTIQEFATQAQLFESKQLDVTGSLQEYVKKWQKEASQGKFKFNKGDTPGNDYIDFNLKNNGLSGLMGNVNIRKAISMSFDRNDFVTNITGRSSVAYGIVPKDVKCGNDLYRSKVDEPLKDQVESTKNKSAEIKKIFAQGLKELGKDPSNVKNIKLTFIVAGQSAIAKQEDEWWKQQIEKNTGATVDMKVYGDDKLYQQDKKSWKFDMLLDGWGADYNDPMTFLDIFGSKNGNNPVGYNNADYDKLLDSLKGVEDSSKRIEIYKQLEKKITAEDYVVAPIDYKDTRRFTQNYVKDFESTAFGPIYEWRWAYISGK